MNDVRIDALVDSLGPTRDESFSSTEVLKLTGVNYRQLDHWSRAGYLGEAVEGTGSGFPRRYTVEEVAIVRALMSVSDAVSSRGRSRSPYVAVADHIRAHGPHGRVRLARGLYLDLDEVLA